MIVYSHLNYRALDQRLRRLEKIASVRVTYDPSSNQILREALEKLPELIAQLPPEIASNAQNMLDDERQKVESAGEEIPKAGEGQNSDVVYNAVLAIARKESLALYLKSGRRFARYDDQLLKELCVTYDHLTIDYPWLKSDAIDTVMECNLRGLPLPRELTEPKKVPKGNQLGDKTITSIMLKARIFEIVRRYDGLDEAGLEIGL
jgi:vacuolar-type H+-ATPase subunit H